MEDLTEEELFTGTSVKVYRRGDNAIKMIHTKIQKDKH